MVLFTYVLILLFIIIIMTEHYIVVRRCRGIVNFSVELFNAYVMKPMESLFNFCGVSVGGGI